ncbi:MAG: DUF6151 family protein [Granulosicoccus sp.]
MTSISVKCQCGEVRGSATDVTPSSGNRVVCCCSDCQAFAVYLGRDSDTLDDFGGTEIFQISQAQLSIQQGQEKLQCLQLKKKGLIRWYTSCCNTPVGNTINAKMPFVGVIHTFMDVPDRDSVLGPVRAYVQTQYAKGAPDYPSHSAKFPLGITVRIIRKMLLWKVQGKQKPSVFFGADGRPIVKPIVVEENSA